MREVRVCGRDIGESSEVVLSHEKATGGQNYVASEIWRRGTCQKKRAGIIMLPMDEVRVGFPAGTRARDEKQLVCDITASTMVE